jgi:hypothetical protein
MAEATTVAEAAAETAAEVAAATTADAVAPTLLAGPPVWTAGLTALRRQDRARQAQGADAESDRAHEQPSSRPV